MFGRWQGGGNTEFPANVVSGWFSRQEPHCGFQPVNVGEEVFHHVSGCGDLVEVTRGMQGCKIHHVSRCTVEVLFDGRVNTQQGNRSVSNKLAVTLLMRDALSWWWTFRLDRWRWGGRQTCQVCAGPVLDVFVHAGPDILGGDEALCSITSLFNWLSFSSRCSCLPCRQKFILLRKNTQLSNPLGVSGFSTHDRHNFSSSSLPKRSVLLLEQPIPSWCRFL